MSFQSSPTNIWCENGVQPSQNQMEMESVKPNFSHHKSCLSGNFCRIRFRNNFVVYMAIGIDTNIEVIIVSLTTWEAHHSPRAKPEGCGELPRSLMRQQWPKLRYQFLFYHDETKLIMNKQILSIWMPKTVPQLSLITAWLHVHILGSCDLIVSPW